MVERNSSTITQERFKEVYQWACRLTSEQGYEEYFWTPETKNLATRLRACKGNMIAVIGLQGSGKSALRESLEYELLTSDLKAYSVKWVGRPEETVVKRLTYVESDFEHAYFDELFQRIFERYAKGKRDDYGGALAIVKKLGVADTYGDILQDVMNLIKAKYVGGLHRRDVDRADEGIARGGLLHLLPLIERCVSSEEVKEIRKQVLRDILGRAQVVLIDLPDYDRSSIRQMSKDLATIQEWWEDIFLHYGEENRQQTSLVIFFQKELFHGHFFIGKLDVYELKPLTGEELLQCYERNFKSTGPFTREALMEIATSSRGIFRRFKKYVRICLDNSFQTESISEITVEHVGKWIAFDQMAKDMELELATMFPKEKEYRIATVRLLRQLSEKGTMTQSKITEEIFEGAAMRTSRILSRLEAGGYIKRERRGKEKTVSLA